jgi:hypothetical protein
VDASLLAAILCALLLLGKSLVAHGPPSRLDGLDYVAETLWSYQKLWQPAALLCFAASSARLIWLFSPPSAGRRQANGCSVFR